MVARIAGLVVGSLFLAVGLYAVIWGEWHSAPPPPPELIRPVKTARVRNILDAPERRFYGVVQPGRSVDLAFQVSGPLVELNLDLGTQVQAGDVLARIDPVRFQQEIDAIRPEVTRTEQNLARIRGLIEQQAAARQELLDTQVAYDAAAARLAIAEKALADSVLKAPFDAIVVKRFMENFQNVQAPQPVARLQDITSIDIAVDLPETVVALSRGKGFEVHAMFPFAPDRRYAVTVKEASAEADPQTQTYQVVYSMPAPEDLRILPGMSATIVITPKETAPDTIRVAVPTEAVFTDAEGQSLVWRVAVDGADLEVRRTEVSIGQVEGGEIAITGGLEEGQEVVVAGVTLLRDGQRVRLMEDHRR